MGKIVTFYSYKGGTGRTMALANVAWVLAASGARVLVVDWDLEAPGLHRYFRPFLADKDLTRLESQGVIDLMADFVARLATPETPGEPRNAEWYRVHADVSKWSKRLLWPSGQDARTEAGGSIEFVPAGRQGPQYAARVNSFDWAGFYERCNGGVFIDAMRASMAKYDWVLIDSRTGVSDTSGICTVQLPDILVVCFTLNYQSIEGASAVARSAQAGRRNGQVRILPLPTRLDGNEEQLLKAMMGYARRTFTPLMPRDIDLELYWKEMGVPYFSRYAYSEKLAPFEENVNVSTSTLPSMERLTAYITDRAVTKLRPLPEDPRAETLAEFEQLPEGLDPGQREIPTGTGPGSLSPLRRVLNLVFPTKVRELDPSWLTAVTLVALVVFFGYQALFERTASPATVVSELTAAAGKELAAGQRERAALLVATAAARLGGDTVVGPVGEPAKKIYDAFLALQPLELQKQRSTGAPAKARTALISPDGRWVAVTGPQQETVALRFPPQGQPGERELRGYSTAAFSPDSRYFATGGRNGSLIVYDTGSGRQVFRWENKNPDSAWVNAVTFSPNGNLVAAGTDTGDVIVAVVESWADLIPVDKVQDPVLSLAFSSDSKYIGVGTQSDRRLFRFQNGKSAAPLGTVQTPDAQTLAFVPSGGQGLPAAAIADSNGAVSFWPASTFGNRTVNLPLPAGPRYLLAVSRDGKLLATGGRETHLWRVNDLVPGSKPVAAATLPAGEVRSLNFSTDGKWLTTGSADGTLRLWDASSGQEIQQTKLSAAVDSAVVSPDGKYIVAATGAGLYAVLVQVKGQEPTFPASLIQALACSQTRETTLSAEQWKQFFPSEPIKFTCGGTGTGTPPRAAS